MSGVIEKIIGCVVVSAMLIALELEAVYVYTGGFPWQ